MSTIGVFDSGVGGLTVVRELRRRFPGQTIFYLGDTARVPYGTKSPRTVERYALTCQDFLLEKKVQLVLVACNTASANALPALVDKSPVPVIGAVIPGAIAALSRSPGKRIAVLGTLGTIRSRAYELAIQEREASAKVVTQACPLFVPLAEEGWGTSDIAEATARRYLEPLFGETPEIDTLVLGCTHYPLLREVVNCQHRVAPLVDGDQLPGRDHTQCEVPGDGPFTTSERRGKGGAQERTHRD